MAHVTVVFWFCNSVNGAGGSSTSSCGLVSWCALEERFFSGLTSKVDTSFEASLLGTDSEFVSCIPAPNWKVIRFCTCVKHINKITSPTRHLKLALFREHRVVCAIVAWISKDSGYTRCVGSEEQVATVVAGSAKRCAVWKTRSFSFNNNDDALLALLSTKHLWPSIWNTQLQIRL